MQSHQTSSDTLPASLSFFNGKLLERSIMSSPTLAVQESALRFDADAWFDCPAFSDEKEALILEVVALWKGQLAEIIHLPHTRRLTLGNCPRADLSFPITSPSQLTPDETFSIPLIDAANKEEFLLCLEPEMEGTIEQNGESLTPIGLVNAGRAHQVNPNPWFNFPLVPGVKASFRWENLEIFIHFVPTETQTPRHSLHSWIVSFGSLAVVGALLVAFCLLVPDLVSKHNILRKANATTSVVDPLKDSESRDQSQKGFSACASAPNAQHSNKLLHCNSRRNH